MRSTPRPALRLAALAGWLALTAAGPVLAAERPTVGSPAPNFTLQSQDGLSLELAALRGKERAVLVFFRGSW
jgi:cytochrome oxidase Cu insertion factor (SCO1/SenC/PrrC family)